MMSRFLRPSDSASGYRSANGMRIKPLDDRDALSDETEDEVAPIPRPPWSEDAKVALGVGVLMMFILVTVAVATVVILKLQ